MFFEGKQDRIYDCAIILLAVLALNVFLRKALKFLRTRLEQQEKMNAASFVEALYLPLSVYLWFLAIVYCIDLILSCTGGESCFPFQYLLLSAAAVLAASWFMFRWKQRIVTTLVQKSKKKEIAIDPGKIDALDKVSTVALLFFTLLLVLEVSGSSLNTLIAFGGIGGIALAFASQEFIANFFGGFMIYLTQPFQIGDWIQVPERDLEGIVEQIGWYMTQVRTLDKRPVYVPNSIFTKMILINPSRMSHRQIKEIIGVRYEDMPKLQELIMHLRSMLNNHPDIDQSLSINVHLNSFGDYSLDILIQCYTTSTSSDSFAKVKEDVLFKIYDILNKHQCEFASHNLILMPEK